MAMTIGGGSSAPVTFITPQGELNASQVNATLMSSQSPATGTTTATTQTAATTTPAPAATQAATQTVQGTTAGGAAAAPGGAAQAVAGAATAAAPANMDAIIAALKSIIQVINQLVTLLTQQATGGGAPASPGKPADPVQQHDHPADKPGQVGGVTGGPVQQAPAKPVPVQQAPVQQTTTQVAGASGGAATPAQKPATTVPTKGDATQVAGASGEGSKTEAPSPIQGGGKGGSYTVVSGDTWDDIAKRYGVDPKAMADANPHVALPRLRVGVVIQIP